jgi:hypothetical protein
VRAESIIASARIPAGHLKRCRGRNLPDRLPDPQCAQEPTSPRQRGDPHINAAAEKQSRPELPLLGGIGVAGATLGLAGGMVELIVGPSVRYWVGNKQETTRLGLATVAVAGLALVAALALRRSGASPFTSTSGA